jgi:hypothetical protein
MGKYAGISGKLLELSEEHFLQANLVFNASCKEPSDLEPAPEFTRLQERMHAYAYSKYGYEPAWHYVAGIGEEFMEAATSNNPEEALDAALDATFFGMQLCTNQRLDFGVLWTLPKHATDFSTEVILGKLLQVVLKADQGIRGFNALPGLATWLLRRRIAHWLFQLFGVTSNAMQQCAINARPGWCREILGPNAYDLHTLDLPLLLEHEKLITAREPKELPALNY